MQTKKYRIQGFVKLTSPLHISAPGAFKLMAETGKIHNGKPAQGENAIPCVSVQKMNLPVLHSARDSEYEWQDKCPVIAANNVNGHLRRMAAAIVFDALLKKGQKVQIGTYSGMTCGAVTGNPDAGMIKFDEYQEAREHVYLGLFGGGPRLMRRYVRVHNLFPVTDATLAAGVFSGASRHPAFDGAENYQANIMIPQNMQMTQAWAFVRADDLQRLVDVEMQSNIINDYLTKIQERQAVLLNGEKKKTAAGGDERFSTRAWTAMEFVIPGISFPMTFELDVTEAQLGLFLLALDRFAATDRLGGCTRNGFGQFVLQKVVLTDVGADSTAGELFNATGRLDRSEDGVAYHFLSEFFKAAQNLSAERLDYLMRLPVEKEKGKKGKKGKKEETTGEEV